MNKIYFNNKVYRLELTLLLVMICGLFVIAGPFVDKSVHAVSADSSNPLCYNASSTTDSDVTYSEVNCPSGRNLESGICYVVTPGATAQGPGIYTAVDDCSSITEESATTNTSVDTGSEDLNEWLEKLVNLLSLAVGLVVTGSLVFAGIQYMTARDNASQVAAAKQRILMAVISLLLFAFTYAILQWLIPGGIFT